jgi:hypothetical protein
MKKIEGLQHPQFFHWNCTSVKDPVVPPTQEYSLSHHRHINRKRRDHLHVWYNPILNFFFSPFLPRKLLFFNEYDHLKVARKLNASYTTLISNYYQGIVHIIKVHIKVHSYSRTKTRPLGSTITNICILYDKSQYTVLSKWGWS